MSNYVNKKLHHSKQQIINDPKALIWNSTNQKNWWMYWIWPQGCLLILVFNKFYASWITPHNLDLKEYIYYNINIRRKYCNGKNI